MVQRWQIRVHPSGNVVLQRRTMHANSWPSPPAGSEAMDHCSPVRRLPPAHQPYCLWQPEPLPVQAKFHAEGTEGDGTAAKNAPKYPSFCTHGSPT